MCVHANCLRKLFLGALMLESIPFIVNGLTPGKATNLRGMLAAILSHVICFYTI